DGALGDHHRLAGIEPVLDLVEHGTRVAHPMHEALRRRHGAHFLLDAIQHREEDVELGRELPVVGARVAELPDDVRPAAELGPIVGADEQEVVAGVGIALDETAVVADHVTWSLTRAVHPEVEEHVAGHRIAVDPDAPRLATLAVAVADHDRRVVDLDEEALEDFAPDLGVDRLEQLAGPQHVAADDGPREVEAGLGELALEPVVWRVVAEALVDQVRDQIRSEAAAFDDVVLLGSGRDHALAAAAGVVRRDALVDVQD